MNEPREPSLPPGDWTSDESGAEPEADERSARRRGRRSPVLAVAVIAFGAYLLVTMFADFAYWSRSATPRDLGEAEALFGPVAPSLNLDNIHAVIHGMPDVQHAARLETKNHRTGYVRILGTGGKLFAALPRDDKAVDSFDTRFEGRMRRLAATRVGAWVREFFESQNIVEVVDARVESLLPALAAGPPLRLAAAAGGTVELGPSDRMRLVVRQPEVTIQLGRDTFPTLQDAERAVAALGVPYLVPPAGAGQRPFHTIIARIPEAERRQAEGLLNAGRDLPATAEPRRGAVVLPRSATHVAEPSGMRVEGRTIVLPPSEPRAHPGYILGPDGRLGENGPGDGKVRLAPETLTAVRVERPFVVDPSAYVLIVGETPASRRMEGILWLLVLALVAGNAAALLVTWRRRLA